MKTQEEAIERAKKALMSDGLEFNIDTGRWEQPSPEYRVGQAILEAYDAGKASLATWQPIETAPKDGTTVMLWWRHNIVPSIGWWNDNSEPPGWISEADDCTPINQQDCTHWMPLPPPPPAP